MDSAIARVARQCAPASQPRLDACQEGQPGTPAAGSSPGETGLHPYAEARGCKPQIPLLVAIRTSHFARCVGFWVGFVRVTLFVTP
jgi:hypothetical protein